MSRLKTCVWALVLCLGWLRAPGGEAASVRLALIPGHKEKAPKGEIVAVLEVELSNLPGASLVERAMVAKLLAEQEFSLSGMVDPRAALKLGKVIQADVFVFLEGLGSRTRMPMIPAGGSPPSIDAIKRLREKASAPPAWRVQAVECRTGVTLAADFLAEEDLEKSVAPLVSLVKSALAKRNCEDEKRRYVALLGFRSAEPGWLLTGTATALGELTATELARAPNVVLLDREHASTLLKEKDLTAVELKLKATALFLEGSVKRTPGAKELEVQATLRPLAGGEARAVTVTVPAEDLAAARAKVAGAVLGELKVAPQTGAASDAKQEAAEFKKRARLHARHGEGEMAVRAMEATVALDPSTENRVALVEAYEGLSAQLSSVGQLRGGTLPEDKARGAMEASLHARRLIYALASAHVDAWARGEKVPVEPPIVPCEPQGLTAVTIGVCNAPDCRDCAESRKVRAECARLAADCYSKMLDYASKRAAEPGADKVWNPALNSLPLPGVWSRDVRLWSRLMHDAVAWMEKSPFKADPDGRTGSWTITVHSQSIEQLSDELRTAEDRKVFEETVQWLRTHKLPSARLTGIHIRLRETKYGDQEAGKELLDLLATTLAPDTRDQTEKIKSGHRDALQSYHVEAILKQINSAEVADGFCRKVVDASLKDGDAARLNAWRDSIMLWLVALERMDKRDEADQYARRMLEVIQKYTKDPAQENLFRGMPARYLVRFSDKLEAKRREYGGIPATEAMLGWKSLRVEPFDIGRMPQGFVRLARTAVLGDELIVVWAGEPNPETMTLEISAVPAKGGQPRVLGRTQVARGVRMGLSGGRLLEPVTCITGEGGTVYVGTSEGGLVACRDGKCEVFTEAKGLPAKGVMSAGCLGGKVYLGLGAPTPGQQTSTGGFVEFDPAKNAFKVLASSRSQDSRSGLDGGQPYDMTSLLADAKRNCVWLGVHINRPPREQQGLWKYTPASGKIEQVWKPFYGVKGLCWQGGKIVAWHKVMHVALTEIDPESLQKRYLAGPEKGAPAEDCRGKAVYGEPGQSNLLWPCGLLGGALITGGKGVFLHKSGGDQPAPLPKVGEGAELGYIELLDQHSDQVFFATKDGRAYRIAGGK